MPSGARIFADSLVQLGIDRIFTLVGDHLNEVLAEIAATNIEIIHMRHESGVTHAADAYARVTRKPAVALVTGGPGHTNALTGIATAYLACSPLIAVSGSRASTLANRGAFQDIDQVGMARPVVKWAAEVTASSQIGPYMARAYSEASTGRQGSVHITIPLDAFQNQAPESNLSPPSIAIPEPDAASIQAALELLQNAKKPVVIAGSGVWWADAGPELTSFIESTNLPLYTITMARGIVGDDHPLCFGFADPALNRAAKTALQEADVILIVGKRIDYRLALGSPRILSPTAKIIQIDIHPQELGLNRKPAVAIHSDAKKALASMIQSKPWPRLTTWLNRLTALREEWQTKLASATGPMHPAPIYREILKVLPENAQLSWDGGDFTHWGRATLPALEPGGWLRLGPLATIGSALPNAIALKLARPDKPVVLITGDGSLGFYIAELDTAVRYSLPMVIIVGNDAGWGLERELQQAQDLPVVACELRRTRYDVIAQGFGCGGENVDGIEQVAPAVERGLRYAGPYLININIPGDRSPFTDWQIEGKKK